jgi:hypothetical protein
MTLVDVTKVRLPLLDKHPVDVTKVWQICALKAIVFSIFDQCFKGVA